MEKNKKGAEPSGLLKGKECWDVYRLTCRSAQERMFAGALHFGGSGKKFDGAAFRMMG